MVSFHVLINEDMKYIVTKAVGKGKHCKNRKVAGPFDTHEEAQAESDRLEKEYHHGR